MPILKIQLHKLTIIIFSLLFFSYSVFAHPHTFMKYKINYLFDAEGLSGFKVTWEFDDMFSMVMLQDYDINKDRTFSKDETALIKKEAFDHLIEYNYFSKILINGQIFNVNVINDFSIKLANEVIVYKFTIPCHVKALSSPKKIEMFAYDPSYFIDVSMQDQGISYSNHDNFEINHSIKNIPGYAYYHKQIIPNVSVLNFRKKS